MSIATITAPIQLQGKFLVPVSVGDNINSLVRRLIEVGIISIEFRST